MDRTLPFELRALEAALAHTCRSLEQESIQVERATLPSLKALMQKVSPQHPALPFMDTEVSLTPVSLDEHLETADSRNVCG